MEFSQNITNVKLIDMYNTHLYLCIATQLFAQLATQLLRMYIDVLHTRVCVFVYFP